MIKIVNLHKQIKHTEVLTNINYSFESGKIYGIFGKNGSGKTMLLRSLAGLIIPTSGEIFIDDKQLHQDISFPPSMGIIIENMELLPQFDARTNLKILSKIKNIASEEVIDNSIDRVGLTPHIDKKVKKYSLGMKQRLNIAQAIFEKPAVILLDEPINAIDDQGIELINQLLLEEKQRGATIIIASHHKEDIAPLCDVTIRMDQGKIIHD
ncbi:ABC transporter ATP-binding protein [Listeria ivanovii]|uniref:Putative ABC transporter (ATP-binding protein) n=1 Tax=Listeria ivanovii (strain ATCC BAA-678 / PAM 55) TaxID=881621 RepID=G2Z883_LISIP|nr:ABC transporter ATP-binding protein [Listeria ivanovii]AHI54647.1 multidrug ABC transporter ATP-binding protein [Listeria ivanovii WSLC3009]AIS64116.1 multidrug ABC transporter ATP-binding protein [Listeria ivanovii subsp. ivanovii]MBC1759607.1 ABC transporter ATP-binding protein [Listeria ivanovii]MCJ1718016.1 ABC transporter ATP-binding protein [Listeria ivanovii]MCJ1723208.1 ABC transporter ATP-binding protein [Listeria ivanovii]